MEPGADLDALARTLVEREVALLDMGRRDASLRDPTVDEAMINGVGPVWPERAGRLERTEVRFASVADLRDAIERLLAPLRRRVDQAEPLCDARLPDGIRDSTAALHGYRHCARPRPRLAHAGESGSAAPASADGVFVAVGATVVLR